MTFWRLLSLNTLEKATISLHTSRFPSFYSPKGAFNRLYSVFPMEEASRIDSHVYVGTLAAATNIVISHSVILYIGLVTQIIRFIDCRLC